MKNYKKGIFILVFISSFIWFSTYYQFAKAQVAEIPFEVHGNHLMIQLKINGSAPKTFIFDSGATSSVLDKKVAQELGIKPDYEHAISGAGTSQVYQITNGHELSLNSRVNFKGISFILHDLSGLVRSLGRAFDGVVGYDMLSQFVTEMNLDKQKIILHSAKSFEHIDKSAYTEIPFKFHGGIRIPQFDITMKLQNGEALEGLIFFDTGASITLNVNTPYSRKHQLMSKAPILKNESRGLGGTSQVNQAVIKSLSFHGFEFGEMTIGLSGSDVGVNAYPGYLGILGTKIINRFNVIFDYSNRKLYMKPNSTYKDSFEFPLVAMKLEWIDKQVHIGYVLPGSEVEALGFKRGQKLIAINDYQGSDIITFRNLLKQEGEQVKIIIEENGKQKEISMRLKRLL